jgi:hypothetical protein
MSARSRSTPTSTEAEPGADPTAEPAALQGEPAKIKGSAARAVEYLLVVEADGDRSRLEV